LGCSAALVGPRRPSARPSVRPAELPVRAYATRPASDRAVPFGGGRPRHFAFLERPDGMDVEDAGGFGRWAGPSLPRDTRRDRPPTQEFDTIGQLYRSIEAGLVVPRRAARPRACSSGPPSAQATEEHFRWPNHRRDRPSVRTARHRYHRGAGRGPRGEWRVRTSGPHGHPRRLPRASRRIEPSPPGRSWQPTSDRRAGVVVPLITGQRRRAAWTSSSGLRGPAPAPVAVLRPHGQIAGAARGLATSRSG
jgi:hypothetical protein